MGQIRWPIFLFFMYMLVLSEKMSIFPKSNMFWILVFSCPKMTLITIFTRMTLEEEEAHGGEKGQGSDRSFASDDGLLLTWEEEDLE